MPPEAPRRRDVEDIREAGKKISEIVLKMQKIQQYATRPYPGGVDVVDFEVASQKTPS